MSNQKDDRNKQKSTLYPFRNLSNYKDIHSDTAKNRDCYKAFMEAKTLTRARKILRGEK